MKDTDRERYATLPKKSVPAAQTPRGSRCVRAKPRAGGSPMGTSRSLTAARAAHTHA